MTESFFSSWMKVGNSKKHGGCGPIILLIGVVPLFSNFFLRSKLTNPEIKIIFYLDNSPESLLYFETPIKPQWYLFLILGASGFPAQEIFRSNGIKRLRWILGSTPANIFAEIDKNEVNSQFSGGNHVRKARYESSIQCSSYQNTADGRASRDLLRKHDRKCAGSLRIAHRDGLR